MSPKTKEWIWIHSVLAGLLVISFASLFAYAYYVNHRRVQCEMDSGSSDYELVMEVSKSWSEQAHGYRYGVQYDGVLRNHTNTNIQDWVVELDLLEGCYVDSYWNGDFTFEDNVLKITCMDYNNTIEAGGEKTFGFVLYCPELSSVTGGRMAFNRQVSPWKMPLFWGMILIVIVLLAVDGTALVMGRKNRMLKQKQKEFLSIINQSFLTFSNMIDAKDSYTKGHSLRVAIYSREIAERMGMDEDTRRKLFDIALLHDIGKIGISDAVLKKKGKLEAQERMEIENHVRIGGDILKDFTAIPGIESGARYHHERYDGTGYASGLKGKEIPLYARIIGVADAFDAMTSARCYRSRLPMEVVVEELRACSGTQFDPEIVPYMLQMIEEGVAPVDIEESSLYLELES